VRLALVYVAGLAVVYAALGVVAAVLGKTSGCTPASRRVRRGGARGRAARSRDARSVDRALPVSSGAFSRKGQRGGYVGAALMGVAAAFVTAPCSAPVLGVLLLRGRPQPGPGMGSALLLVFALGLSLLLLVLGIFSGLLTSLPRPGRWMVTVKKGFGIVMLLLGAFYLWKAGQGLLF